MVSASCPKKNKLMGLLHDADEAYLLDLASPIKHGPGMEIFNELGHKIQSVIFQKFGIDSSDYARVKTIDKEVYNIERMGLMPSGDGSLRLEGMPPLEAERRFLEEFYRLSCSKPGPNDFRETIGRDERSTGIRGSESNEVRPGQAEYGTVRPTVVTRYSNGDDLWREEVQGTSLAGGDELESSDKLRTEAYILYQSGRGC